MLGLSHTRKQHIQYQLDTALGGLIQPSPATSQRHHLLGGHGCCSLMCCKLQNCIDLEGSHRPPYPMQCYSQENSPTAKETKSYWRILLLQQNLMCTSQRASESPVLKFGLQRHLRPLLQARMCTLKIAQRREEHQLMIHSLTRDLKMSRPEEHHQQEPICLMAMQANWPGPHHQNHLVQNISNITIHQHRQM
jgi:hypothetical protein